MGDLPNTRLVSGEIMTGATSPSRGAIAAADIVEADFETIAPAPVGKMPRRRAHDRGGIERPAAGLGTLRGETGGKRRRPRGQRAGAAFWLAGMGIAAVAFWISGGHALFSIGLDDKATGEAAGLRISGLSSSVEKSARRSMLLVDGEAVNDGAAPLALPPLGIDVTGLDGSVTRYRLGTSGRSLGEGERFAFSGRFEVPKEGVRTVSVTFIE